MLETTSKPKSTRRSQSDEVQQGGRFTGSTYKSRPMKAGNSVEDKTLMIRTGAILGLAITQAPALVGEVVDERR